MKWNIICYLFLCIITYTSFIHTADKTTQNQSLDQIIHADQAKTYLALKQKTAKKKKSEENKQHQEEQKLREKFYRNSFNTFSDCPQKVWIYDPTRRKRTLTCMCPTERHIFANYIREDGD